MNYTGLAAELLNGMQSLHKAKSQRNMNEAMQGEAFILGYIARRDQDVLPGEISQEMGVSSARVAAALNSLEKKAWITRRIDEKDRRKILVGITPEGKEVAGEHQRNVLSAAAGMLALLG
ncbi:MAG: MarR family transcriptional regulator, partial [Clostridia bacterium]|nr:MarR family transcriptional regulator [Clostridia bacterium]